MSVLTASDGTRIAYHESGEGAPVVCLPGGPLLDAASLGDLGGLARRLRLIQPDYRGAGRSETPTSTASYRCDALVDDVEALRVHLRLERINVLAHCAGANVAVQYAARHPERVNKLVLVTPSTYAVDITVTGDLRREIVGLRKAEPWFAQASAAFEAIQAGQATDIHWDAITPLTYGRWDDVARAHYARDNAHRNEEGAAAFGAEGAFDPPATRAALAAFDSPVLLLAGELDVAAPPRVVAEYAALFPHATLVVQPEAGHVPWLDDPTWFADTIAGFVDEA
ncbi:MAG: alpha/beta fold hydrolase [Nocardioidaceae bacterium]